MIQKQVELIKPEDFRLPSDAELELVSNVMDEFYKWRLLQTRTYSNFGTYENSYLTPRDYWKKSRELFWGSEIFPIQEDKKFWIEFFPEIRRITRETISSIVSLKIKPKFVIQNPDIYEEVWRKVLEAVYDRWRMISKDNVEKFWQMLYASVNGTLIVHYGFLDSRKQVRNIVDYDPKTQDFKIETEEFSYWNDVYSEIIPLENIYFPTIEHRDIQKIGKCIIYKPLKFKEFQEVYKNFENAKYVYPSSKLHSESLYFKLLGGTGSLGTDYVDVIIKYDAFNDEYVILANGIWINPIKVGKKEQVAPLPFNHKMLPLGKIVWEPIDEKFFWGASLPMLLKAPQKYLNLMMSLLLEREAKEVFPPILSHDIQVQDLKFGSGEIIPVSDINAYRELTINPASPSFFTTINILSNFINAGAGRLISTAVPTRQPKTATERRIEELMRTQIMNNILLMYWDLVYQEVFFVLKTALQYYSYETLALKIGQKKVNLIKEFIVPNFKLNYGGLGNLIVRIVKKNKTNDDLLLEEAILTNITTIKHQIIEARASELQKLNFMIHDIVLEPQISTELDQMMFLQKAQHLVATYAPLGLIDMNKALMRTLEKFGEVPNDWIPDQLLPMLNNTISGGNLLQLQQDQNKVLQGLNAQMSNDVLSSLRGQQASQLSNLMQRLSALPPEFSAT
ncbi:MAG: hypothetical protein ABIL76_06800 [candidate division WOR-3 bacterium]